MDKDIMRSPAQALLNSLDSLRLILTSRTSLPRPKDVKIIENDQAAAFPPQSTDFHIHIPLAFVWLTCCRWMH
jgi:hypothetical protein